MSAKAGRGSDQFVVRLPDGMRDRIKAAAETNNRSMNAEIVATLEKEYPATPPDIHQVTVEVLQLLGLLTVMTEQDRIKTVSEKENELRKRGVNCEISMHKNTLKLLMASGNIKYEFELQEAPPDDL
ncbi:Arc family DNA-binding protein [Celeribacter persicus]|uniref:Arc-like DNA binding dprotein n=1 Tax=Celeribacter persicus TaxID=1651082 RepID=A0A2T5HMD1_9RHOB|nr:Arc family DNA-binding protein [Celeribacter persicus]PTQ72733.1 Arc-like DNA binding dprotein [Celeribacter persicus]